MNNEMDDPSQEQAPPSQGSNSSDSNDNGGSKAQRQPSKYIDRIVRRVLGELATDELKQNYAKAMVMSVNLGRLDLMSPCHPQQIRQECRFNPNFQRDYGIILSKDHAIEFLQDFCFGESRDIGTISETSFKRQHTRGTYEDKFHRPCFQAGRRKMLCTYAEWLYVHDYLFEPQLPQELMVFLPDGWKAPPGSYTVPD